MIRFGRQSLTEGTIWKSIILFAIPLLLSNFLQQLYNTADLLIVGRFSGATAMASVGATGAVTGMLVGLSVGLATGCSVIISQLYGAEDYDGLYKAVHSAFAIALLGGVVLTVAGIGLAPILLSLMNTPETVIDGSVTYMRIYFGGIIPTLIYNMGAGILNAVGDSRRPFFFLCVAAFANVVFDLLFVGVLSMGVAGAAIATVIAQSTAATFVLISLTRTHSPYRYFPKDTRLHGELVSRIVKIGLPAGMQSVLISISNVFIQTEINRFGEAAVAGIAVAGRVDGFVFVIMNAVGLSAMTFTGQNVGAGQWRRVKRGYLTSILLVVMLAAGFGSILLSFRFEVAGLFNNTPEVLHYATRMMSIILPTYFIFGINEVTSGYLRGQGKALVPMIATLVFMCGARLLWIALVLPFWDSIDVVIYAYPVSWILTLITLQTYNFLSYRKQKMAGKPATSFSNADNDTDNKSVATDLGSADLKPAELSNFSDLTDSIELKEITESVKKDGEESTVSVQSEAEPDIVENILLKNMPE
jgi:putative MATE family efflux protein